MISSALVRRIKATGAGAGGRAGPTPVPARGSDSRGSTYLERWGTRRAAGRAGLSTHSRAVAARTRKPQGRRCRQGVCPEGEVCCPPSPQIERVPIPAVNWTKLGRTSARISEAQQRTDAAPEGKLRRSPCANFVPRRRRHRVSAERLVERQQRAESSRERSAFTPFPASGSVVRQRRGGRLSSQRGEARLEAGDACFVSCCLARHERRIM